MLGSTGKALAIQLVLAVAGGVYARAQADSAVLASPDRQLVLRIGTQQTREGDATRNKLVYSATFRGKQILDNSGLALELEGQAPLGLDVHILDSETGRGVDAYTLTDAKVGEVSDAYNSLAVHVEENGGARRIMTIEARAYNDGIAFRYLLPAQDAIPSLQLRQEDTEFRLTTDATNWALELPNFRSSYESEYVRLATSAFSYQGGVSSSFLIGLPLLIHEPGTAWMALMEADLEGSTSMYVANSSGDWAGRGFISRLSPRFDRPEHAVEGTLPYRSAWRVLLVADNPGRLLESNLSYDLNPPSRIADTSWIRPGKASWDWWVNDVDEEGKPSFTTANMKRYVDFSAQSGFPYMMLDAGWSGQHDITKLNGTVDVPELVRYAAAKNVKIWIWIDATAVREQMKEAFPLYEKWGVAGVKIDFVDRDDQQGTQFYYDVGREAAEHHLMVDFHGTRTPWGLHRTYPNVLSYEGVLGMEYNKFWRRDTPAHRVTLAFTRLLAGPMDYTPGGFRNVTEEKFESRNTDPMVMGTRAQQLALYVVFESPFQMASDSPQAYANQPAFQFIRDVPVAWDETRVLDGNPDEFITIVRRHGEEWDLGSITNWTPRTIQIPSTFLASERTYTAEIYEDSADAAKEPTHVTVLRRNVRRGDTLTLHLAPGGGCAIRFVPEAGR